VNGSRSPSPISVDNPAPTMNTNKSLVKRPPHQITPVSTKPDDFVLIPEHVTAEKSLPIGRIIESISKS
jgi:hypothetical protein